MIRYRSARTAPGVNPPTWIESDDASLPTREEDGGRCAFRAIEGDATFVGSCDTDDTDSPQEGQKRAESGISEEQAGQGVTGRGFYAPLRAGPDGRGRAPPLRYLLFVDFPSAAVLNVLPSSDISHFQV